MRIIASPFDVYLGLDQTGAVDSRGRPKPLPAAILTRKGRSAWRLIANLRLAHFNESCVRELIAREAGEFRRACIAFDVALGLPAELKVDLPTMLKRAREYEWEGRAFGSRTAHEFFQSFLREARWRPAAAEKWPVRHVEAITGANSVFQRYPFQKNVACGSFRALKELAEDPSWCAVWPFQKLRDDQNFLLAESYPSLLWRKLLGARTRNAEHLSEHLVRLFPRQTEVHGRLGPDAADAAVLAFGTRILVEEQAALAQKLPAEVRKFEGWILGLTEEPYNELGRAAASGVQTKGSDRR